MKEGREKTGNSTGHCHCKRKTKCRFFAFIKGKAEQNGKNILFCYSNNLLERHFVTYLEESTKIIGNSTVHCRSKNETK